MNTLNKSITRQFFFSEEGYSELKDTWSSFVNDPEKAKTLSFEHHLAYAILRGKDWRKCFTPITNSVKLSNGQHPEQALRSAIYRLKSAMTHPVFANVAASPDMIWKLCSGNLEGDAYNDSALMLMGVK